MAFAWSPAPQGPLATAALAADTRLVRTVWPREKRELLEFAIAAHADSTRRWQPSFFDRRAERSVDASRLDLARRTAEHERRMRELGRPAAPPRLEPVLATAGALMPAAIDGGLLSSDFLASGLVTAYGDLPALADVAVRAYARDLAAAEVSLGPASGARAVFEASVRALVRWLGWILDEPQAGCVWHAPLDAGGCGCGAGGDRRAALGAGSGGIGALRGHRCARRRAPVGLPDEWAAAPDRGRDSRPISGARL